MSYIQGLEQVVTTVDTRDKRAGKRLANVRCDKCGAETATYEGEFVCGRCKSTKHTLLETAISANKVADTLNRRIAYKCPECLRMYDTPTPCCLVNKSVTDRRKEAKVAWFCTGCRRTYYHQPTHECCTGSRMMKGKAFKATKAEFDAMPKFLKPIGQEGLWL